MYESLVTPVILYNAGCAALTDQDKARLDACHRRHLRKVMGIKWPAKISNEKLYKVTGVRSLSVRVEEMRWRMLGHVLRLDRGAPAQRAMDFAFGKMVKNMDARRGRHSTNLLSTITNDLKRRGLKLSCKRDLDILREVAADRIAWKKLTIATPEN